MPRERAFPSNGAWRASERNLTAFGRALKARLREPRSRLARAYMGLLADRVVVGEDQLEIRGSDAALLDAASRPDFF